eukprot:5921774-Lingulodinium_polyedra.AAC.1
MSVDEQRRFDMERCIEFLKNLDSNSGNRDLQHGVKVFQLCQYLDSLVRSGALKSWSIDEIKKRHKWEGAQECLRQ